MSAALKPDVLDYLAVEATSADRHEFYAGEIVAMGGARPRHNAVAMELALAVGGALRGRPCLVFASDQRIRLEASDAFCYPDLTVVCGAPRFVGPAPESLVNPTVVFEVVSPSTERWDRGGKFGHYRACPSLRTYVLLDPRSRTVEWFERPVGGDASGEAWVYRAVTGDTPARLDALGVTLVPAALFAVLDRLPPEDDAAG